MPWGGGRVRGCTDAGRAARRHPVAEAEAFRGVLDHRRGAQAAPWRGGGRDRQPGPASAGGDRRGGGGVQGGARDRGTRRLRAPGRGAAGHRTAVRGVPPGERGGVRVMDSGRANKLADRIAQIVAEMLERRVKDPRLGFVTVTDAKITGDLREATVY